MTIARQTTRKARLQYDAVQAAIHRMPTVARERRWAKVAIMLVILVLLGCSVAFCGVFIRQASLVRF